MKNLFYKISAWLLMAQCSILFGQTWEAKDSGTDYILFDISIPAGQNNIAYAAGSQFTTDNSEGIIIKSADGGETWEMIYTGLNIQKIEFVTETKGFAVGYNGIFLKTTDGGNNWTPVSPADDIYVYHNIDFLNENHGFFMAVTTPGELVVYMTSDGGETWIQSENAPANAIVDIDYGDSTTLYAVGFNGSVNKSEDSGNTWSLVSPPGWAINVGVSFKNADNGFYAGEEGDLHFTSDGGATWTNGLFTGWHHFTALAYKGIQAFAGGTDEDLYISYDNGLNWENIYNGTGDSHLYEIAFFDNGYGLICGSQGTLIKFSPIFASDVTVSAIDGEDNEIEVGETIQLEAHVTPENINQNVEWSIVNGNDFITIDTDGVVAGLNEGIATVRAVSVLDESVYGDFEIIVTEGMNTDENGLYNFSVYPNPAKNELTILSEKEIKSISVLNPAGQQILNNIKIDPEGKIDISPLAKGIYFFQVYLKDGQIKTLKIIKE